MRIRIGSDRIGRRVEQMTKAKKRKKDRHSIRTYNHHRHIRDGIYQCLCENYVIIHVKCLKPLLNNAVAAVVGALLSSSYVLFSDHFVCFVSFHTRVFFFLSFLLLFNYSVCFFFLLLFTFSTVFVIFVFFT